MGCLQSAAQPVDPTTPRGEKSLSVEWKLLPSSDEARNRFERDGTLPKDSDAGALELRTMLEDPLSQNALGKYARSIQTLDVFMCWVDIQVYKSIPTDGYRRSQASHIYHKYVKPDAVLVVGDMQVSEREKYKEMIDGCQSDPSLLDAAAFDKLQRTCFNGMYHNIYLPYKQTDEYFALGKNIKKKYNHVRPQDFEYFNRLGEGGFGFVIRCKKKSTGKFHAMKIQTKCGLLDSYVNDPWRADYEKQAFASCQHPFIVNMDYAFQTDTLAIMVLGLSTAGDLNKAMLASPNERLPEDRVRFYAAEIVLALDYLHQLGLIYRDLKPANVLLGEDGHIKLLDMGGVADEYGGTLGKKFESDGLVPLFAREFNRKSSTATSSTVIEEDEREQRNISSKSNSESISAAVPTSLERNSDGSGSIPVPNRVEDDSGGGDDDPHDPPSPPKRRLSIMGTFG